MPPEISLKKTELSHRILYALYQEDPSIEGAIAKEAPNIFELAFSGSALLHLDKKNVLGLIGYAFDKSTLAEDKLAMKNTIEEAVRLRPINRAAIFAYFHLAHHQKDTTFWDKEKTLEVVNLALLHFPNDLKLMLYSLEHSFYYRNYKMKGYERDIDRAKIIASYMRVKDLGYSLKPEIEEIIGRFREESKESTIQSGKKIKKT